MVSTEHRKCDRCGFIFEHETVNARNLVLVIDKNGAKSFELCPRCLEKCTSWLEGTYKPTIGNTYSKKPYKDPNQYDTKYTAKPEWIYREDTSTGGPTKL